MIFADLVYEAHYSDEQAALVTLLTARFAHVEHGLQGDAWIWISDDTDKVTLDTFYTLTHRLCCTHDCALLHQVADCLAPHYRLNWRAQPEPEPHEG